MGTSATPAASLRAVKPTLDVWPVATLVATVMALGVKAIAAAVLVPMSERHVYGRAGDALTPILLSAGSIRPLLSVAVSAVLFVIAYVQLPRLRAVAGTVAGLLLAGALLGTVRWFVIRAVVSYPVPMPLAVQTAVWISEALFCGPALVWTIRQFAPASSPTSAPHNTGRRVAYVLAAVMPVLWLTLWLVTRR